MSLFKNNLSTNRGVRRVLVSFTLLIGTLRVNFFFVLTFFGLTMLFSFIAAADFSVAHATTEADVEHIAYLLKIGGGFGFIGLVCGWYVEHFPMLSLVVLTPSFLGTWPS